jgi:phosphoglycolate phosphatase
MSIVDPLDCQRFETAAAAADLPLRVRFATIRCSMKRLLLFDIDGTLTRSHNGHVPFNQAILETFGVPGDILSVIPDGNTDPMIVTEIFSKGNILIENIDDKWEQFSTNLRQCYSQAISSGSTTVGALPGAAELLQTVAASGIFGSSVVSGNLEPMARVKLEAAGLYSYLCRGAYGSDSPRRAELPAIAKRRCEATFGISIPLSECIVIGDTPRDLEAARHNQMKCILVATGRYPLEELLNCQADLCLSNLTDTAAVVEMLLNI